MKMLHQSMYYTSFSPAIARPFSALDILLTLELAADLPNRLIVDRLHRSWASLRLDTCRHRCRQGGGDRRSSLGGDDGWRQTTGSGSGRGPWSV